MLNTRITHYDSEAYDLPSGVIYYVGSPLVTPMDYWVPDDYVLRPLEVSADMLSSFLDLHPDFTPETKRLLVESFRQTLPDSACRTMLAARLDTADRREGFAFLEADVTDCDEDTLAEAISSFVRQLRHFNPAEREYCAPKKSAARRGLLRRAADSIFGLLHEDEVECKSSASMPEMDAAPCGNAAPCAEPAHGSDINGLLDELQRRLASIPQSDGVNILLQRQFEDFFRTLDTLAPRPLSELQIDGSLRILLTGYDLEIPMLPVWKALYILFLRHEEGIILNRMPDYRDELARIYRSFAAGEPTAIDATIDELTTPGSDIFRQYKSKINAALRRVLAEDLAQHYIISGSRNEPYRILLPRDKVQLCTRLTDIP